MARQKGMLNLSGNLEPLAGAPLDSRSITPTVADLYIASNWPYKYIGMKTTVTATGDTYRLVNLDVTQESSWVKEGGESGQTIQYDELPAASSSLAGKIYQYTGTTNLQYTNGYFYECVNDSGTYKWQQTNTQPGSSYNDFTGATAQAAGVHGLVPAPTTGDISKFLKGDGTWATVPMPSFDYSNTSPEAMNFSTDEKVIGTWIDGKPLYQKTVNFGALPKSTGKDVAHGISNIDSIVGIFGISTASSNNSSLSLPMVYESSAAQYNVLLSADKTNIHASCTNDRSVFSISYVTIRYTKTTDSPVASGEKIVGQWIDGKPVYEKVLTGNTKTEAGWKTYDTGIGSGVIDKVISMNGCIAYSNGWTTSTGSTATGSHIMFDVKPATGEWEVYVGDNGAGFNCPAILILRYTKTT